MNLRIDAGVLETVAGHHDDAHASIQGAATSMPSAPATGVGGEHLAAIVRAVAGHASDISVFNEATAALVRQTAGGVDLTDSAAGDAFRSMQSELEG